MTEHSAPVSVALTRHMLWRMLGAPHPMSAHRWDSRAIFARGGSADAAEGVSSFLEKRHANFNVSLANDYPWSATFADKPTYTCTPTPPPALPESSARTNCRDPNKQPKEADGK